MSGEAQGTEVSVGSVIAGRFRIERSLGTGGMAEVFASRDLATGRPVAVKLLKRDVASNPEAVERLRREGEVLKKLEHPTIVRLETFGKLEDGRLFIAMELLEGETLGERMRREGRMEPADLAPIVAGACAGLSAAHEAGIVHRDLKPDNIFLESGPQGMQVKLLDFGISKITGSDKLTQTGEVLGTPRYMAPEQLSAERDLDGRTDVYALGVILYEALAGSPPFLATTPTDLIIAILHGKVAPLRSFRPDLPEGIDTLVARAMSRAREARHGSARELAEAWLAAAGPAERSSLPGPAREGMTTSPLGSLDETPSGEQPAADTDANDEGLRPGTFSALAAAPAEVAAPVVAGATAPADPPASAERETKPLTAAPGPAPASGSAAEGRPRRRERTEAYCVPTSGGRTLLVVGGVVAGALSAALAIVALKVLNPDAEAEPTAAAASDAPPAAVEPAAELAAAHAPPEAEAEEPSPATEEPAEAEASAQTGDAEADGDAAADDSGDEAAGTPRPSRRRERRSGGRGAGPSSSTTVAGAGGPAGDPAPTPPGEGEVSAAELMRQARAALRRGDAQACVNIVERAIEAGATSMALRLRGDCLVRAGDRIEALKSYERFCRLAPDHPAIGEVRAVVESLGGRCD